MAALPLPDPPLSDGTLTLRPWREADLPAVVEACQDPLIVRFVVPIRPGYSAADGRAWLLVQEPARLAGTGVELAITDADDGELLGAIGLVNVDAANRRGMIGYWVAPQARGRGVASGAVRLLAGWALGTLGLARIELLTDPDNAASQRVAERCGFTREGIMRSHLVNNGERRDSVLFSLLPGELR
jgi:RimJ/RimL family protein N-acetyltransferase